jgi:hypothetical protein
MSKNAYVAPSLLQYCNGTNSNHLEKCSIITKTYKLCWGVKLNGPEKSKLHQHPSPIIGKSYRWNVGALKDARTGSHTIHLDQIVELIVASLATNIVSGANYMSVRPQNGPTFHEHASQGFHVVFGKGQPSLVDLPTYVGGNYFPI